MLWLYRFCFACSIFPSHLFVFPSKFPNFDNVSAFDNVVVFIILNIFCLFVPVSDGDGVFSKLINFSA
jgi:hypothetical protein